jgi:7-cyano-7-deazaguanine tRNA-ribosyltransferase
MDYYVSWTHSDPVYQQQLDAIRVLVSPPNVSLAWRAADWQPLPESIIFDSGAYQYHRERRNADPATVLRRQLQMAEGLDIPTGICHLDVPMLGTRNLAELDQRVERNLANARWLIDYAHEQGLPEHVRPIGVIQGYTVERVYIVARALADIGYTSFALGSLAGMVASARDELLRRVEAALEAVGPNLHILGVSSALLLPELRRIGVRSADSGAPGHEAWRGGIFYSHPFRRYKIASPYFSEWQRSYSFAELLSAPLPCACPVCQEDSGRLLEPRGKMFVNLRAIHNCYHLTRELTLIDAAID